MEYVERLAVPLRWWVQGIMLIASLWLAVLAAIPEREYIAWLTSAVALALMSALFLGYGAALVAIKDGRVRAGRATMPLQYVGAVTALDPDDCRRLAGVDADARAFLLLRPYLKRGVRIDVDDPKDPTPYWLVNCRRPDDVVAAVEANRVG